MAQFCGWLTANSTAFATSSALRNSTRVPYSIRNFDRKWFQLSLNGETVFENLTSGFFVFPCNSVVTSPGWMHVTFMLCGTNSCLIASETLSPKYFVPEYTAKPANGWNGWCLTVCWTPNCNVLLPFYRHPKLYSRCDQNWRLSCEEELQQ